MESNELFEEMRQRDIEAKEKEWRKDNAKRDSSLAASAGGICRPLTTGTGIGKTE